MLAGYPRFVPRVLGALPARTLTAGRRGAGQVMERRQDQMPAWQFPNGGRSQATVDDARAGFIPCPVCQSRVSSNPNLVAGGPTEE